MPGSAPPPASPPASIRALPWPPFASGANDGIRVARAYQAFWDYGYPLEEIGAFLGIGAREVQAMLDQWDRL